MQKPGKAAAKQAGDGDGDDPLLLRVRRRCRAVLCKRLLRLLAVGLLVRLWGCRQHGMLPAGLCT